MTEELTMDERAELARWIQPHHLEPPAVASYRERFAEHPARLLHLNDFLLDDVAAKLTAFLADEAEYGAEFGIYSVEGAVDEARFEEAAEDDRFFRLRRLAGIPEAHRFSPNALTYMKLRQTFQRPEFERYFEMMTGLSLGASDDFGTHRMISGDFLRAHSDDNKSRRLAIVLYLTPGWHAGYGGGLRMVAADGTESLVTSDHNSIAIFDVLAGSSHSVEPVTDAAGETARLTIGGWYHRAD